MKKIVSLALALVLVLSLTACGGKDGGKSADPNLGKYIGTEFSSDGDSWYSLADLYDGECYIELKSDGKGVFCLGGEATDIKWSLESDGALTLKRDGLESNGLLQDGCIMLDDLWGNEVYTLYEKEDADSSPEKTGDTLLDWWNGDWYGWWKMTGCSGYYEDMEGDWWDICGNIDIGADKTGVVRLWDEDYSRDSLMAKVNVTLSTAGTGEHGTMTSEDGQFTDIAIEHADWIVDPGLADRDDLICIDGYYENGEDEFYYEIYLRPWGIYWDDADEDSRPKSYDDWYLPLIKAGKSMPDAIGADAPASSGDTKSTAPSGNSNAPSGTGLVSEEAVQKGYVWMNEVNNNIFDTTYEDLVDYFGVEGEFVKEEYSDHMKRNQRYYKWVSKDDSSHYVYVNFAEEEPGVYKVSAFNTSGFSGKEAIEKYPGKCDALVVPESAQNRSTTNGIGYAASMTREMIARSNPSRKNRYRRLSYRINHISWWAQELPSDEEYTEARRNLDAVGWQVDYIITHCAPTSIALMGSRHNEADRLTDFLQEVRERAKYHYWLFGHYHDNKAVDEKHILLWEQIVQIC